MKKFLGILVLSLLWCNIGFAADVEDEKALKEAIKKAGAFAETHVEETEPKYVAYSLNKNIIEHGWKVKSKRSTPVNDIFTLTRGKWILVCQIVYKKSYIDTVCALP